MDVLVLADQERHVHQFSADTDCSLEDLPGAMDDGNGRRERERERERERVKELHVSVT